MAPRGAEVLGVADGLALGVTTECRPAEPAELSVGDSVGVGVGSEVPVRPGPGEDWADENRLGDGSPGARLGDGPGTNRAGLAGR